ncbi:hypothetical protein BTVI_140181 [Pitangus sulphuratus]|nr:hypothetical protein BTVI_140181 [Pitangus sulphuratus]
MGMDTDMDTDLAFTLRESLKPHKKYIFYCQSCGDIIVEDRSQFVQTMVAQCLVELSSAKSTFRFTVKGDNGKTYILSEREDKVAAMKDVCVSDLCDDKSNSNASTVTMKELA